MFLYLQDDDVRLDMFDRNIIRRELDLNTDLMLTEKDKPEIGDFFYNP